MKKSELPSNAQHKQRLELIEKKKKDLWDPALHREPQKMTSDNEQKSADEAYRGQREWRH